MSSESRSELTDAELGRVATELCQIARGSSWARTLATGKLVLKYFFGGDANEWRTRRRQKEASIRRLAQRPDCPLGRSALSEAVALYVAKKDLPKAVDELTPSHVAILLRLPPPDRLSLIETAVARRWSVREIRAEALKLKRRAGERRGRPRFLHARAAVSHLNRGLDSLGSSLELLGGTAEVEPATLSLLDRALSDIEAKLGVARGHASALAGDGLKSEPKASPGMPLVKALAG